MRSNLSSPRHGSHTPGRELLDPSHSTRFECSTLHCTDLVISIASDMSPASSPEPVTSAIRSPSSVASRPYRQSYITKPFLAFSSDLPLLNLSSIRLRLASASCLAAVLFSCALSHLLPCLFKSRGSISSFTAMPGVGQLSHRKLAAAHHLI